MGYAAGVGTPVNARQIMSADEVRRALVRMSHEIVEKHGGAEGLALVGIEHRGPALAARLAQAIAAREGVSVPVVSLDVTPYRDDRDGVFDPDAAGVIAAPSLQPFDPTVTTVVLVDDVLYTGRTARAALDALMDHGRPSAVRLAVLIDRGHRELPIRADHVGRNVPTARSERVQIRLSEDGAAADEVLLLG
jgi:pyrimidine operon attenuation protein/uracil phosphoribosyltransferase